MDLNQEERTEKYLTIFHHVSVAMVIFFLIKYNLSYQISEYNIVILLLLSVLCGAYFYRRRFKNIQNAALVVYLTAVSVVGFLIFTAGAIHAPGVFWLSLLPMVGGIILGPRGHLLGSGIVLFIYLLFMYIQDLGLVPNFIEKMGIYEHERIQNLFLFSMVSSLLSSHFLNMERKAQDMLNKKTLEANTLLRLLMHDVASPTSVIRSAVVMIDKKGGAPDHLKKYFKMIDNCTNSIIQLLKQIRNMAAVNDGKIEMSLAEYDLHEQIDGTLNLLQFQAEAKDITFRRNFCSDQLMVKIDAELFKISVLSNILTNSLKFSPRGSHIDITTTNVDGHVEIAIRDYGIGIPEELLKDIFHPDRKTSRVGTNGEPGTGYGMIIMRAFIEKFEGELEIQSVTEEIATESNPSGTKITLRLPRTVGSQISLS